MWQFDPQRGEVGEGVVLKQEYFRRFPEDVELKGCIEMEGGKDGRNGRRKQGEEISWYRCAPVSCFCAARQRHNALTYLRSLRQRLLLSLCAQVLGAHSAGAQPVELVDVRRADAQRGELPAFGGA